MPTTSQPTVVSQSGQSVGWRERIILFRRTRLTGEAKAPLLYTGSSIILSFAQMLSGVVLVRWMDPRELGLWQSVFLALPYTYLLLGGINNGLSRELPYFLGNGDDEQAKRLTSTTQFYTAAGCLLALIAGIGMVSFLTFHHYDAKLSSAVAAVTLLIIVNFSRNYLTVTFRSRSSFVALSWTQVLEGALMIVTLPLVYYLRYYGMLLRLVVVGVLVVFVMFRVRPLRVKVDWDLSSLRLLLKTGIPIFALDYFRNCMGTADRLALLHFGGVQQVGFYALAMTVNSGFEVLPNSVAHYIYPRMSFQYGRDKKAIALWSTCRKTVLILLAVMIPVAALGWLCLPGVIMTLFPKYAASTRAAQLMLCAAVGAGLAVSANTLWSLKAWKSMVAFQVASGILAAVLPLLGVWLFVSPLTGVAAGTLAARFLSGALGLILAYFATHKTAEPIHVPANGENDIAAC